MYDSWNNYHLILLALAFPKGGLRFLCFKYYRRYKEFGSDFNFVKYKQNCRNLNEIVHISGNIKSTKIRLTNKCSKLYHKIKTIFKSSCILSCFVGHPVSFQNRVKSVNKDKVKFVWHCLYDSNFKIFFNSQP